jgi:hypothetical protein
MNALSDLTKESYQWLTLSDADLLAKVKAFFPSLSEGTRDELMRQCYLEFVERRFTR